jgi:hypothetical protein
MVEAYERIRPGSEIHPPKRDFNYSQVREIEYLLGKAPALLTCFDRGRR